MQDKVASVLFENQIQISETLESFSKYLENDFLLALEKAYAKYILLQSKGLKEKLHMVQISFLRTGILLDSDIFRIDLLSSKEWEDTEDCSEYIEGKLIYDHISNIITVESILEKTNMKPTISMLEQLRLRLFASYMENFETLLSSYFSKIRNNPEFSQVKFQFGEFMGQTQPF